jgi:hypothetical protein
MGFELLTAMVTKSSIFWDITSCSPLKANGRFGGTCHLQHKDRISRARYQGESWWQADPEDGGDMFPQKSAEFQRTIWPYIPEDRTLQCLLLVYVKRIEKMEGF